MSIQFLNIKAWMLALSVVAGWIAGKDDALARSLVLLPIMMGFGLDSDAIHSPNEHFGVFNYLKGIETIPLFYKYFVALSK